MQPPSTKARQAQPVTRPENALTEIHETDRGLVYEIPAGGFWKGTKGLGSFAAIWTASTLAICSLPIMAILQDGEVARPENLIAIGVCGLFPAVGVVLLVIAANVGSRRVMIGILKDELTIRRTSMFGTKWIKMPKESCLQIRMGASGAEINDEPVMELQILNADGRRHGLLSQLKHEELRWLADDLARRLDINDHTNRTTADLLKEAMCESLEHALSPPENSKITVERQGNNRVIFVPAIGLRQWKTSNIVFTLLTLCGMIMTVFSLDRFPWRPLTFIGLALATLGPLGLLGNFVYCHRRFEFRVGPRDLEIIRRGPFATKHFRWKSSDLEQVCLADIGGVEYGRRNYFQLQILTGQGHRHTQLSPDTLSLLYGRSVEDLAYLAATLSAELSLEPKSEAVEA